VSVRVRLKRLERQSGHRCPMGIPSVDVFGRIRQFRDYLRGEGPRPPEPACPPWCTPEEWEARMRKSREYLDRVIQRKGALAKTAAIDAAPGVEP
jgi:hypothetical protein